MRVEFFEPKLEQGIVHEILQWSKDVLETNSSFLEGCLRVLMRKRLGQTTKYL